MQYTRAKAPTLKATSSEHSVPTCAQPGPIKRPTTPKATANLNAQTVPPSRSNNDIWDDLVPRALFTYRSTVHESTGFTPALVMFGQELHLPFDLQLRGIPQPETQPPQFVADLIEQTSPYKLFVIISAGPSAIKPTPTTFKGTAPPSSLAVR